ncbi:MAG: pyruvate carboxylase subunit B [Candidatus Dormibacteria bacterium]
MAPVELVESSLRHGQQALLLSRLRSRHILPVARLLDRCGFAALDVFGGTTFEASLRFLAENPFDRLRAIRAAAPSTPLLATIEGRALVGHRRMAGDVIDAFIRVTAAAGIDIFRCYDPLNDVGNLERCIEAVHAVNRVAEGVICYTDGSADALVDVAARLAEMGFDHLCLYDPLGLPGAARAGELVRRMVDVVSVPVNVAFAAQTGQAGLAYWSAAGAGARRVDVALAPLAGGASFPPAEALIAATMDTELRTGLDVRQVAAASDALDICLPLYQDIIDPTVWRYDHSALRGLLPASAMPHALAELSDRGELDRIDDVEQEITRVRSEMGYPPLVPPITEIIATQAVYNVCGGDRYATISQEFSDYCRGLYGRPPEPVDPSVRAEVGTRPVEDAPPSLDDARQALVRQGVEAIDDEAAVCYALFPAEYLALARGEAVAEKLSDEVDDREPPATSSGTLQPGNTEVPGSNSEPVRSFTVEVDGQPYSVRVTGAGIEGGAAAVAPPGEEGGGGPQSSSGTVVAPMPGLLVSVAVAAGDAVAQGEVVAVLEAMKMQNEILAPQAGTVRDVLVGPGAVLGAGDAILRIG